MKYFLKQALFPIMYLIFMAIIAAGIGLIGKDRNDLLWLKIILYLINLGFYIFIMGMTFFKEGQEALKIRHANDLEREEIVRTGEALPLKLTEEYKPWKGFVMGLIAAAPLVICMFMHLILILTAGEVYNGAGVVASLLYLAFFAPYSIFIHTTLTCWQYFILLYAVVVFALMAGLPYVLGAKKQQAQYDKIAERQRMIYGDKK